MPIEELSNQKNSSNIIKSLRCLICGHERQITHQWLQEVSPKLSVNGTNIDESQISHYLIKLRCSKCNGRNIQIVSNLNLAELELTNNSNSSYASDTIYQMDGESYRYAEGINNEIERKAYVAEIKRKKIAKETAEKVALEEKKKLDRKADMAALEEKKKLDREAYLEALKRYRIRNNETGGIPEYEEGAPRSEWGTREDYKKMRVVFN